jgi:hypothetical protein
MHVLDSLFGDGIVVIWFGAGVAAFIAALVIVSTLTAKERRARKSATPVAAKITTRVPDQWVETRLDTPSPSHADLGSSVAAN